MTLESRFWPKVERGDPDWCWTWIGSFSSHGYGQINLGPRGAGMARAHRVAYELTVGPIPEGLSLDHLCRNTACVNPKHLDPVTHAENMRRARRRVCKRGHNRVGNTDRRSVCLDCKRLHNAARYAEEGRLTA